MGRGHEFSAWHSSDDVASTIDAETMYCSSFLAAVYAYFAAAAEDEDATWLAEQMLPLMEDGLVEVDETAITATPRGRLLLRSIAACFDAYLHRPQLEPVRYSRAV